MSQKVTLVLAARQAGTSAVVMAWVDTASATTPLVLILAKMARETSEEVAMALARQVAVVMARASQEADREEQATMAPATLEMAEMAMGYVVEVMLKAASVVAAVATKVGLVEVMDAMD